MSNTASLKKEYAERIAPALKSQFQYSSTMQVPVLKKIVINQGLGMAVADKKIIEVAINEMTAITGQKAVATISRKDIANFKLRKKMPIGVTLEALNNKKHVVTANKALLAHYGKEIFQTAKANDVHIFYEASVGGGIPVLASQKESLIANNTKEIVGILNGTTNFILTLMENENLDFDEALSIADGLRYVEANPALDLDGIDAAHKICILAQNGYQKFVDFDQIQASGIRNVTKLDMDYAKKLGYRFKMIAQAKPVKDGLGIDVSATLVNLNELVANVMDSYNVVEIDNDYVNNIIYYGRGAGRYVTASAVVSDIMKTHQVERWSHDYEDCKHVYPISSSRYYVRASKPVDIPYETYYSEKDDHIYITEEIELADLKNKLNDKNAVIFKVRG